MINKVVVKRNQLALFHTHQLTTSEVDYLIRHFPIKKLNELIDEENLFSEISGSESYTSKILQSLVKKIDIFNKEEI